MYFNFFIFPQLVVSRDEDEADLDQCLVLHICSRTGDKLMTVNSNVSIVSLTVKADFIWPSFERGATIQKPLDK